MKFFPLKLTCVERITEDSVRLTLDVSEHADQFKYLSGQYITFCFNLSDENLHRAYSVCSAPHENKFQVAVKEVPKGRVSLHANRHLTTGDTLNVNPPQGNFVYKPDPSATKHVILFGAGSGITPLVSIAKTVLHNEPNSRVTLFYGNRSKDTIMFYDEIDKIAEDDRMDVYHILSDGSTGVPLFSGRINFGKTLELLYNFANNDMQKEFFICGPGGMMNSVKNALKDSNISDENIHMEYFENPGQIDDPGDISVEEQDEDAFTGEAAVKVILDDEEFDLSVHTSGKTILDAALDEGADAPFSCQGGVCTSCKAKLLEGKVRMLSNFALTDQEMEEGYILTCQAHPTSKNVKISYDE